MATLAPLFLTFLLIPVFSLLFYFIDHSKCWKNSFLIGWWFGLGFFLSGTYWIALSLLVDSTNFAWMIPFATLGLSSILATFYGLAGLSYYFFIKKIDFSSVTARIILFSIMFAIWEVIRGHSFTGFPWNAIGYSMSVHEVFLQPASVVGIYGLNLLVVMFSALPAVLLYKTKGAKRTLAVAAALLITISFWGYIRISETTEPSQVITARIVQGNIAKERKWDKEKALEQYSLMSQKPSAKPIDLIVWPESSFPYYIEPDSGWNEKLALLLKPESTLLMGTVRVQPVEGDKYNIWNSLAAINSKGETQYYDKHHLVPFGEYVPFRNILPIKKVIPGKIDFTPSLDKKTLQLANNLTIGSLICYEAIFSRHAFFDEQINLLVNITNDGWFSKSAGPYQHLHMARLRAVEQAVPIIRAANSGISAVYDEKGRLIDSIGLKVHGFKDISIALTPPKKTLYSQYGLGAFFAFVLMLLTLTFVLRHDDKR